MNRHDHELSAPLADAVRAAQAAPADAADAAQARLLERLRAQPRPADGARRPALPRWLAAGAVAALAVIAVLAVPLLPGGGDAFAAVQQRLREAAVLDLRVIQRIDGQVLQTSRTVVDRRGVLRTDVGAQLSVIVDPPRRRVLTLLHDSREARVAPLSAQAAAAAGDLGWLRELRDFQGRAERLPDQRDRDGRTVQRWSLRLGGTPAEMWADAAGLPLRLRRAGPSGLRIDYRFTLDPPLAPGWLSSEPPPGYALADAPR
ncbi:hypothetical protein GLE_0511 [Lysobacter enzymogenes]|uniref:Transmembrane protein n=1 Tax=Lysobacter enzymogenes TaxID=69 RepID=A0A0S2DBU8_LYSEN|nr:hypothetical protein [Lysobacter enzymogenes]ALN55869.1 hypothetical protein GLE_0511 [Lysobacter enzymogenes]